MSSNNIALYSFNVSSKIGDYIPLVDDLVRMGTIQVVIQLLYFMSDSKGTVSFFSGDFVMLLLFVLAGVATYHLLVKKAIVFT